MIHPNLSISNTGNLMIGGADVVEMAVKYGTPLYIIDEDRVRENCRTYLKALRTHLPHGSKVLYASKALCYAGIFKVMKEESMCIDIVSAGEHYTALRAGFPAENMFFHGNSKPDSEIEYAVNAGVGHFVVDSLEELDRIDMQAGRVCRIQKVLLRVTPNIDTHTHKKIATGTIDCKFGTPIETGQAENFVKTILAKKNVRLDGLHCHVGSQIFDEKPYCQAAEVMVDFIADLYEKTGWLPEYLNLGGGFGVRYTEEDPQIDYAGWIERLGAKLKELCEKKNIPVPALLLEPGRSIVGDAGITVYSVTGVKEIPEHASYVAVDGGMTDNPRYALYEAKYTMLLANKAKKPKNYVCTVAGRCCESGDLLGENIAIQKPVKGDLLTVLTTGAYNYSMASNYNRVPRPAMVAVRDGREFLAVRRESFEDLIALDTL